jgi:DNA polymerase (family 10)
MVPKSCTSVNPLLQRFAKASALVVHFLHMSNTEIAKLLRNVAAAYAIKDEKKYRFQLLAYQKAADSIEHASTELKELYKENKLNGLPGVGPSIQGHLAELFKTGEVKHFDSILKDVPAAVFPLMDIPSFGPKKAYKLVSAFKLSNPKTVIEDVYKLAEDGKIAELEGFGAKSAADIKQAISEYGLGKTKTARMVLPYANELANKMIAYLKQSKDVVEASPLGSLRRKRSTIGDIDIAVATNKPEAVLQHFVDYPHNERTIEKGDRTSSIIVAGGKQIDLMVQPPDSFGSLLQHFTGSKAHNIHLREHALSLDMSLSEYGIRPKSNKSNDVAKHFDTEEKFYNALGLQWIPPEIREDTGEIELAKQHKLPKLVELKDIKGDFHLHSSYPIEPSHDMGANSMEEMLQKAMKLNYNYLGFSEHNPSQSKHTAEEIYKLLEKRKQFIEQLRSKYNKSIRIFSLLETDILPNGKLAIEDKALELLDATIVSVHSVFSMSRSDMTKRVLQGLSHPKAKILAHPTGRLLNQRPGYDLEWDKIFVFCKEHNKALEINSWPLRLDLPDNLVREAVKQGVKLIIDTDSHATDHMDLMEYGVFVARRGWATPDDILNTMDYNELEKWFKN